MGLGHAIVVLVLAGAVSFAHVQTPQQNAGPHPPAAVDPVTAHMTAGADALAAKNFARAAAEFESAVALAPGNQDAQFWSGQALVYEDQSRQAIPFLEKARALGLDSVGLHLALVEAYADAGDNQQRDEERALLSKWHSDGKHPSLERAEGFRVEVMTAGTRHVNVFEYFQPNGERHARYRFSVRDAAQIIDALYVLDSDDSYQADFARHHPRDAAQGKRRYALVKYSGLNLDVAKPQVYKYYNGEPDYDEVRSDVLRAAKALPVVKINKG